jgi:hypothetical protein
MEPYLVMGEALCNWRAGAFAAGHTVSSDSPLEEDGFELPVPRKVDDAFETAILPLGTLPFRRPTHSRDSNPLSSARFDIFPTLRRASRLA